MTLWCFNITRLPKTIFQDSNWTYYYRQTDHCLSPGSLGINVCLYTFLLMGQDMIYLRSVFRPWCVLTVGCWMCWSVIALTSAISLCCAVHRIKSTGAWVDLQGLRVPWTLQRLLWPAVSGSGRPALKLSKYGGTQSLMRFVLSQLCFKQDSDSP